MNLIVAVDISTFIWCEEDYNINQHQYFKLLEVIPVVYESIKSQEVQILFRAELYNLIIEEFPYNMARRISYDFEKLTLSFFSTTISNWLFYTENSDKSVSSAPEIIKPHYSRTTQVETLSQICYMLNDGNTSNLKFITYNYFFNHKGNLQLKRQQDNIEIETLFYNLGEEVKTFFEKFKIRFEHNPKHNKVSARGIVSPLSCYNERLGNIEKAQKLLEEAFLHQNDYYNFDNENSVYVRFIKTSGVTYHGHDFSDEGNNIPNEVKKKFNKNGRRF